ncbi:alpha/beta fold hydrolase [Roseomonas sp. F4]
MTGSVVRQVETSHGTIAVEMSKGRGPDVVLLHGNSSCRGVFRMQLESEIGAQHRLISFDLPGHGESSDAPDKDRTYPLPGLAEAALELLEKLHVERPVLLGWSLGGHIAMEMLSRGAAFRGLFITGAPPVGPDMAGGFKGSLLKGLAAQGQFTREQARQFVEKVFGQAGSPLFKQAAMRVDGAFRRTLFSQARFGEKSDQRQVVSTTSIPTAVVNGADDPVVNLDYIDGVPFSRLWRRECIRLPGAGHAPFLQNTPAFNDCLQQFLRDLGAAD